MFSGDLDFSRHRDLPGNLCFGLTCLIPVVLMPGRAPLGARSPGFRQRAASAGESWVWREDGTVQASALVRFTAPDYLLSKRGENRSSRLLMGGGGVYCFPGAKGWVPCPLCRAAISSAISALEVCLKRRASLAISRLPLLVLGKRVSSGWAGDCA